jgi:predicted Zn-dependent protease
MSRRRAIRSLAAVLLIAAAGALGWYLWARHQEREAQAALLERDFPRALTHLKAAMFLRSTDPFLYLQAAKTARRSKNYSEAMEYARVCEKYSEMSPAVAREYALWRVQDGDLAEGLRQLDAYREKPDAPGAVLTLEAYLEGLLQLLTREGVADDPSPKFAEIPELAKGQWAADEWLRRQAGRADQVQGLVWRGRLRGLAADYQNAVADLRLALAMDPYHFETRWYLAAQIAQESPGEAESHLSFLLDRHPDNKTVRYMLAHLRRNVGQLDSARSMLDELLESSPNDGLLFAERGMVELDAGRPEDAELWLRRAEGVGFNRPELMLALGRCMRLAGRIDEATRYEARFEELEAQRQQARVQTTLKRR